MKKIFLIALFTLLGKAFYAQNKVRFVNQTRNGTVGTATVLFSDNTTVNYQIGGPGTYVYNIGTKEVSTITIGQVPCEVGQTVTIPLSSGGTATESLTESIQDEAKGFSSLIR